MSASGAAVVWLLASLGFGVAWVCASAFDVPLLWYLPIERRLVFGSAPTGLSMVLYGQLLFATVVGAAIGFCGWATVRRRELTRLQLRIALGSWGLFFCFAIGYYAFEMWGRIL